MPSVHMRDLTEETMRSLKRRARAHHRSVEGESRKNAAEAAPAGPPPGGYPPIRLSHVDVGSERPWTRESIYGDAGR